MPKGKRGPKTEPGHKKAYTLADHCELYEFFADENGNMTNGMHRGHPIWVIWYCLKGADAYNQFGDALYHTTDEERKKWAQLVNVPTVVLRTDDMRSTRRGFRTRVMVPAGIPDPDYEKYWLEWEAYRAAQDAEASKPKARRQKKTNEVAQVVAGEKAEEIDQQKLRDGIAEAYAEDQSKLGLQADEQTSSGTVKSSDEQTL